MADPLVEIKAVVHQELETGTLALKEPFTGLCFVCTRGEAWKVEGARLISCFGVVPGKRANAELYHQKVGRALGNLGIPCCQTVLISWNVLRQGQTWKRRRSISIQFSWNEEQWHL